MTTTAHEDQFTDAPEPVRHPYDTVAILRRNVADLELALRTQTERAESYAETLRSLASYVGAGGYNADKIDAGVFEQKIRWGIGQIMERLEKAEAELAQLAQQEPVAWMDAEGDTYKEEPPENWCPPHVPLYASFAHVMHKGATHCDDCGLTWLDDGLNPLGCPYCKDTVPAPAVPEEWRDYVFAAADELRLTVRDLKNGFVRCGNCGEQETTSDLDCVSDIDGALELLDGLLQSAPVPAPSVPYGVDEEAANRIALAVYDCKHGINQEPLLYAINRILATEAHPLSAEGQRALLQSTPQSGSEPQKEYAWECNECGAQEYTMSVGQSIIESGALACGSCGCDEFHKAEVTK